MYFFSTSRVRNTTPDIWFHTFAQGTMTIPLKIQQSLVLDVMTNYPWTEDIEIQIRNNPFAEPFQINLRIPEWCESPQIWLNGHLVELERSTGAYSTLTRQWLPGDALKLNLPMPVRMVESHPDVLENSGRVALARGPLLYCLEQEDHPGVHLQHLAINPEHSIEIEYNSNLLGGINTLETHAWEESHQPDWHQNLYRKHQKLASRLIPTLLRAIPYHAWANRSAGPMQVWIKTLQSV
jgi:uncharacterized protein